MGAQAKPSPRRWWTPVSLAAFASARQQGTVVTSRVLVSEPLAQIGLDHLTAAGFDVDLRTDLTPEGCCQAVRGASALIIRSATQVTEEVLDAGRDLVVVGRAGHRARQRRRRRRHPPRA